MYRLEIRQGEKGGWLWTWHGPKFKQDGEFNFALILDCYNDAAVWAMRHGPDKLCHAVISLVQMS